MFTLSAAATTEVAAANKARKALFMLAAMSVEEQRVACHDAPLYTQLRARAEHGVSWE